MFALPRLSGYGMCAGSINARALLFAAYCALFVPNSAFGAEAVRILGFGDSLMAGYGLDQEDGFTARLEAALRARGVAAEVVNAGVSGDTSSGGRARLDWVLAAQPRAPDLVILELGGNDALRGIDPAITRANIDAMIALLKGRGIRVLLAGMLAPPNMGPDYAAEFNPIFPELAQAHDVPLYPFFLEGVAAERTLNQADGIHPNARGVEIMVERIMEHIVPLVAPAPATQ